MGKYLTQKEVNMARHEQEIWNSMLKRGMIDPSQFVRTHYVVCGCGAEGCGFITQWRKRWPDGAVAHLDLAEQKELYQQWLEAHKETE